MKVFTVSETTKLSRFLLDKYEGALSYATLNKLYRKKDIKVNGKRVSKDATLNAGDEVTVYYDGEIKRPEFDVLFEDENIFVVKKPKRITSEDFYERLKEATPELYFCHRLDRGTDGVMLFAKNERAYSELLKGFKERTFDKYYLATVCGTFKEKHAVLNAYLVKDAEAKTVKVFDKPVEDSVTIKTEYTVLKEFPDKNFSEIEVKLWTGRTHQIRAHMAHIGHFVLGDGKYGSERVNRELKIKELQLSSYKTILHFEKNSFLAYLDGKVFSII